MDKIKFTIKGQDITMDRAFLVSDTRKVYQCEYEFSDDWDGYVKWAVFKGDYEIPYKKLIVDNECEFESASIRKSGYVICGVVGYKGDKRKPTIYTLPAAVRKGADEGSDAPIPTPSEWEQVLEYISKIDELETYIPEGTSEENQLVNADTLSDELERVEDEIPTKYSDLQNDNHTVQDENYVHTDNNFTNEAKQAIVDLQERATKDEQDIEDLDTRLTSAETNISNLDTRLDTAETDIDTIKAKIPSQATSSNQLADKEFVNSSVATSTATFQGTFDVVEDLGLTYEATHLQVETALESIVGSKTNNDYVFVFFTNPTTEVIEKYERYKFTSDDNSWNFEYVLNNSSFTSNQWASINSGITSLLVAQITTNKNDIATINQSLTALANRVGTAETNITDLQTAIGNVYTKSETYKKEEVDSALLNKANVNDVYTKTETNTLLDRKADKTALNETDRRLQNLYDITQGKDWNFETETVNETNHIIPSGVQAGGIDKLYGNSLPINQLVENGNFESTSDWIEFQGVLSVNNNIATFTVSNEQISANFHRIANILANNKYYMCATVKTSVSTSPAFGDGIGAFVVRISAGIKTKISYIYTPPTNRSGAYIYVSRDIAPSVGDTIEVEDFMLINLTPIESATGLTFTTTTDVENYLKRIYSYVPSYIDYGYKLLDFNDSAIKIKGINQWDEEYIPTGYILSNGNIIEGYGTRIASANFIEVKPNTEYHITIKSYQISSSSVRVAWYDKNKILISVRDFYTKIVTSPSNAKFMKFNTHSAYNSSSYKNDISINYPSTDTSYHQYIEPQDIPIPSQVLPLRSARNVRDEIVKDLETKKVISINLGTFAKNEIYYFPEATYPRYQISLSDYHIKSVLQSEKANVIMTGYITDSAINLYSGSHPNYAIGINGTDLWLYNTDITSIDDMYNFLQDKYINVELAQYVQTSIDLSDTFKEYNMQGGGTLLGVSEEDSSNPNYDITYIVKLDESVGG